jgi:ribosomal protein L37AE/L43A
MIKSYYGEDKKDARNEICPSCGGKNCKRDGYPWDICDKCGYSYPEANFIAIAVRR